MLSPTSYLRDCMHISDYLAEKKQLIDQFLDCYLPAEGDFPPSIHKAMRYTLFAGGKRLRPILALAACEAVGGDTTVLLPLACSLELIHTYSLIHDDLPAMDNDDYRRGQPANHKIFGEDMAILAGDALLTQAFSLLAKDSGLPAGLQLQIIREVSKAAGSNGLIGGQVADIQAAGGEYMSSPKQGASPQVLAPLLEYIHTHKTGALFRVALKMGALSGGANEQQLAALTSYGEKVGLAFQIMDDILDVEGSEQEMGKPQGSDRANHKLTYPATWGMADAKQQAQNLIKHACQDLEIIGEKAKPLKALANFILQRRR